MIGPGWIGEPEHVLHVLGTIGADRDAAGNFLIFRSPPITGLTGELVIPADCEYAVNGVRVNLAALLRDSGYGVGVTVIS